MLSYLRAYVEGFRAGWDQPHDLCWTKHYEDSRELEWHDNGTILGQKLRSPRSNQSKTESYRIFPHRRNLTFLLTGKVKP